MTTGRCASLLACVAVAVAGGDRDARFSPGAQAVAATLSKAILAEAESLDAHPWAGIYHEGDGMGENVSLAIAPRGGFVFEWRGCLGDYDRNYGSVEVVDERLRLTFTFENRREGFEGIAPVLLPVVWGERHYLVPADDVVGFCNEVNQGDEPRVCVNGRYLLRKGDEARPAPGWPDLPAEYRDCLLPDPVSAACIGVGTPAHRSGRGDWKFQETPVTIDAGRKQGLRPGMELYVTEPTRRHEWITLKSVAEDSAEGVMIQDEGDASPKAGWRFSTRPPWRPLAK